MRTRTTINLDDDLMEEARNMTGVRQKTELIHRGLRELIAHEAARRLAALGGSMPGMKMPRRRRSPLPPK
ncbi:MAG: type II toxin-antitoxin system VapB family antitoxin [Terriglobales bacterium]